MASNDTWRLVNKYFKKNSKVDNWGDPNEIDDTHLLRLFDFRTFLGSPIIVTHGVKTRGHSEGSYHYKNKDAGGNVIAPCATDIIIPEYDKSPFDLILDATRMGFTGIGYYPHWKYKGKVVGGLHVDSRPLKFDADGTINFTHSRWMGIVGEDGKQRYIAMDFVNMVKYTSFIDAEALLRLP